MEIRRSIALSSAARCEQHVVKPGAIEADVWLTMGATPVIDTGVCAADPVRRVEHTARWHRARS